MTAPLVLGIDPSLSACGWAVVQLGAAGHRLVAVGCVETAQRERMGKGNALAHQHDAARRGCEVAQAVQTALYRHDVVAIGIESPLTAQDASAAWAMARAHQAVWTAARLTRPSLRPFTLSALEAKRWTTGKARGDDSKGRVRYEMRRRLGPSEWERAFATARLTTDKQQEAAYDAAAVALCVAEQPSVRALLEDHRRPVAAAQNAREAT